MSNFPIEKLIHLHEKGYICESLLLQTVMVMKIIILLERMNIK